jgi:hypothetical protein
MVLRNYDPTPRQTRNPYDQREQNPFDQRGDSYGNNIELSQVGNRNNFDSPVDEQSAFYNEVCESRHVASSILVLTAVQIKIPYLA